MHILFLHSSSDLYGASKILLAVTKLCKDKNHKIIVVLSEKGELSDKLIELGCEVLIIDLSILRRQYFNFSGILNRAWGLLKAYNKLTSICETEKVELIYSNTTGVIVGILVASKLKIPHIWHIHEIIEKPTLLFRLLSALLNKEMNRCLVVSEAVKNHWAKYVKKSKITVLYNGVDYWLFEDKKTTFREEQNIPVDAIVIGMMGRVHYWKGQDYFLKIAGQLHQQFSNLFFVMVGDAFPGYEYLYDNLEKIIIEEKLEGRVIQVNYRSDIQNIYNSLNIFILPSQLPDPAPAVVTEAMAAGLPVIVTNQGGAIEMIIDGISGMTIPLNDAAIAANKIASLIKNKEERINMGAAAKARINQYFSRENFNTQIINFIEQK
jgi:glycosyltransferase involved in cell wall biosynthesis